MQTTDSLTKPSFFWPWLLSHLPLICSGSSRITELRNGAQGDFTRITFFLICSNRCVNVCTSRLCLVWVGFSGGHVVVRCGWGRIRCAPSAGLELRSSCLPQCWGTALHLHAPPSHAWPWDSFSAFQSCLHSYLGAVLSLSRCCSLSDTAQTCSICFALKFMKF